MPTTLRWEESGGNREIREGDKQTNSTHGNLSIRAYNKERYYETMEQSSKGWHEGNHDPWPYMNYLLSTMKAAYREFETRLGAEQSPRGAKTDLIICLGRGQGAPCPIHHFSVPPASFLLFSHGRRYDGILKTVIGCGFSSTDLASGRLSCTHRICELKVGSNIPT